MFYGYTAVDAVRTGSVRALSGKSDAEQRRVDPKSKYQRYMTYLRKSPLYQDWIRTSERRDSSGAAQQQAWVTRRSAERPLPP